MKPLSIAPLLAASLVSAPALVSIPAARADVVELRSGERVEGTFKSADDSAPAQEVIAESKRKSPFIWRSKGAGEGATTGMVIATDGLAALWSCASAKLAEAEKLRAPR